MKARMAGLFAGALLSVLAGGIASAVNGIPFDGSKGAAAFWSGLVFPRLTAFGPLGASGGAIVGAIADATCRMLRASEAPPVASGGSGNPGA